jgi:uncharacterized protein (TIGR01244 family)
VYGVHRPSVLSCRNGSGTIVPTANPERIESVFRKLNDQVWASPQISVDDVAAAAAQGIRAIVNNRPEGESGDQTPGETIAAAARAAGMNYRAIPVTHAGFSQAQVSAMAEALNDAPGPVLAYCRSGTRSTLLWALARASQGECPEALAEQAAGAGYDLGPIRSMLDMLASGAK